VWNGFEEVYVNAAVKDGSDIAELMSVFTEDNAYSNKFPKTSEGKHRYKTTEGGKKIMCDIMEKIASQERAEGRDEGRKKGLTEGKTKEKNETAKRLIMKHTMSAEEIAEITELPLDVIINLKNSITNHA
jgi:predicted transposase/invertase (TIGR01784 family)